MMFDGGYGTELGIAGGAIGGTLVVKFYDWWLDRRRASAEEGANVTLVAGLADRVEKLEARLHLVETDNTKLRNLLYDEQNRSARLGLRVIALEHEILKLGGVPPAHPHVPPPGDAS